MAALGDFETFVEWVETLIAAEGFDEGERDYKLELSLRFKEVLSDQLSSEAVLAWLTDSPNNIVGWRTTRALADVAGNELAAQTSHLFGEGDLEDRIDRFGKWLNGVIGVAEGEQATVASALLMGFDATQFPPYKTNAIRTAMRLAGRDASTGLPSIRYKAFLDFCDEIVANLAPRAHREVDRLDVQGACWIVADWSPSQVSRLLPERHSDFVAWRTSGQAGGLEPETLKWWVNQGGNYDQERDESRIWAPQTTKAGHSVFYHTNVLEVLKGDRIVHNVKGHIRAIGIATSDGYKANYPGARPDEMSGVAGCMADVEYQELADPIPLSSIDEALRATGNGPFALDGRAKQGYLYRLPEEFGDEIVSLLPDLGTQTKPRSLQEVVETFVEATFASGLRFGPPDEEDKPGGKHKKTVRSFVTALATKPFVILTGLSGSGKTRLAQSLGDWLGSVKVIAVRPDWTSPDPLLGFENALSEQVNGRYAWNVPDTLRFILQARDQPDQPHLLVLDEMNLAHVERYFADVLSGMESGEPVVPDLIKEGGDVYRLREGPRAWTPLPENLFVVGTVNVDETTYMFSPKVLDRANTFEFRVETPDLVASVERSRPFVAEPGLVAGFLKAARTPAPPAPAGFEGWLRDIHKLLASSDREFGHRTFQEALRFAGLHELAGEHDPLISLDLQIAQKVLPRLHGSRRELSTLIDQLGGLCFYGPSNTVPDGFECAALPSDGVPELPVSFSKLHRMAKKLRDNHFVSFAE
ncbi:MAG: hypothetical protein F4Z02_14900 [Acidimicrobiia bacterium]|nr:hypothetical protein [Acidimicrobiia bacterium]MYG72378.1 hypothetical protein [Acidimicrobiia bacterium]